MAKLSTPLHSVHCAYYHYQYCTQFSLPFKEFNIPRSESEWKRHWLFYVGDEIERLLKIEFCFELIYLILLYHTDYGYILENRLSFSLADLYREESMTPEGKCVDLLRGYRSNFEESIRDKKQLNRESVLKLIQSQKELIFDRIK